MGDLSKPNTVEEQYQKWMETLSKIQSKLLSRCTETVQEELKVSTYRHIQFYVNPKDDTEQLPEEEKEEQDIQRKDPESNLGAPIVVVATKCDAFRSQFQAEADAEDHFEIMCSYIRWWCMQYGAASFSMSKGLKDQARRILSYIDHRVFDSKFDRGPNAVVKLANLSEKFLFIPSGFDSKETIKAQNPNRQFEDDEDDSNKVDANNNNNETETKEENEESKDKDKQKTEDNETKKSPFSRVFKSDKKKKMKATKPKMRSDENDSFLKGVKFDIDNGDQTKIRSGTKTQNQNGVDVNDFFQRLLGPSQAKNSQT